MVAAVGQGWSPGFWWADAAMLSRQPALHRTPPHTLPSTPAHTNSTMACGIEGNPVRQGRAHTAEHMDVSAVLRRSLEK